MGFDELQPGTRYIECLSCTDTALQNSAKADAMQKRNGTYYYLLGNISTNRVWRVSVEVEQYQQSSGEPSTVWLYQDSAVSSPMRDEFSTYVTMAKAGATVIEVPGTVSSGYPTNEGGRGDIAHFLRGHSQIAPGLTTRFIFNRNYIVTVRFSDGTTAQFMLVSPLMGTGLSFVPVPNSRKDANGNALPDPSEGGSSSNGGGGGGGGDYQGMRFGNGGGITPQQLYNIQRSLPNVRIGTITVGPPVGGGVSNNSATTYLIN